MRIWTLVCLLCCVPALAQGPSLPCLAPPDEATLTLYAGQVRGLMQESRPLRLPAGVSPISFSWSGVKLDPASVTLRLSAGTVGEATRPAGQDRTIVWQVTLPQPAEVTATISYFVTGCKWQAFYRLAQTSDGKSATLTGDLQLTNETGADLERVVLRVAPPASAIIGSETPAGTGLSAPAPCSVHAGDTKLWPFLAPTSLPARIVCRFRADASANTVTRALVLQTGNLADQLPPGSVTVCTSQEGDLPLLETQLPAAGGPELELDLGANPDLVVERKCLNWRRVNLDRDRLGRVAGADTIEDYETTFRNHLSTPVTVEVWETVLSTWEIQTAQPWDRTETGYARYNLDLVAGGAQTIKFTLTKHSGTRIKK